MPPPSMHLSFTLSISGNSQKCSLQKQTNTKPTNLKKQNEQKTPTLTISKEAEWPNYTTLTHWKYLWQTRNWHDMLQHARYNKSRCACLETAAGNTQILPPEHHPLHHHLEMHPDGKGEKSSTHHQAPWAPNTQGTLDLLLYTRTVLMYAEANTGSFWEVNYMKNTQKNKYGLLKIRKYSSK